MPPHAETIVPTCSQGNTFHCDKSLGLKTDSLLLDLFLNILPHVVIKQRKQLNKAQCQISLLYLYITNNKDFKFDLFEYNK